MDIKMFWWQNHLFGNPRVKAAAALSTNQWVALAKKQTEKSENHYDPKSVSWLRAIVSRCSAHFIATNRINYHLDP